MASTSLECHGRAGGEQRLVVSFDSAILQTGKWLYKAQILSIAKHGIRRTRMFANGKRNSAQGLWTMEAYIKRMRELPLAVQTALEPKKAAAPK